VSAYIYTYDSVLLKLGHLEYRRAGLYTSKDAPSSGPPGDGEAYIDVQVNMTRSPESAGKMGILQLLVTHSSTFDHIGYMDQDNKRHFCCTQDLLDMDIEGCRGPQLGKAVVSPRAQPPIEIYDVLWNAHNPVVQVSHRFAVPSSGRYYLLFSSCLNSTGDVEMSGKIVWMNPYGYLPGELYHFIPLFGYLTIGYAVLGLFWGLLCLVNWKDLLHLQHYVTVVIVLGLLEAATWYFDYQNFNTTGKRPIGPVIIGVLLSSVKRTLSRLLVLIVCMGYGVMKPALESDQKAKVIVLGVVYFFFSSVYDVMSSYSQMTYIMQHIRAFFLFPVAALDSLFFLWILQEISGNIQHLTENKQQAKLRIYQRFWQILVITALFSVFWALYQVFVTMGSNEDSRWDSLWAFEGMWHIIYFAVLIAISVLWRPSANASAYAYSEQLKTGDDDDDELGVEMTDQLQGSNIKPAFTIDDDNDSDQNDN